MKKLILLVLCLGVVAPAGAQFRSSMQKPKDSMKYLANARKKIDGYIATGFRMKKVKPMPKCSDDVYVRRAYLDIVGRIPTYEEVTTFLADESPNKRFKLASDLLDTVGYEMNMYHWWADLLRLKSNLGNNVYGGKAYINWVRNSVKENKPYNQMVTELLAAKGSIWDPNNGAVGYYVRDRGMPLDNMANTTRIFLGTQIACAQCHDHPFDKWTQMQFYQMAAFTAGTEQRYNDYFKDAGKMTEEMMEDRELRNIDRFVKYNFFNGRADGPGQGWIKLPKDYAYKDAEPMERVGARSMFKDGPKLKYSGSKELKNSREQFASWVTDKTNPTFTKVIANRMWKKVMGVGLVEPVDNFKEDTKASHPQLMTYLVQVMKDVEYDLQAFQRILYSTATYQQSTQPQEWARGTHYDFSGRQLFRMSAEQVWDSLLTLTIPNPDDRVKPGNAYVYYRNKPVFVGKKDMHDLQKEVDELHPAEYWDFVRNLKKQFNEEISGGKGMMMMKEMEMMSGDNEEYGSYGKGLVRASELPSPAPNNHFLRKFGQSDRNTIDGASREGDVTQVLTLLNGHVEQFLLSNYDSVILSKLYDMKTKAEKIEYVFLSILSRKPSAAEMEYFTIEANDEDIGSYKNMIAALMNTSEFIFIQ